MHIPEGMMGWLSGVSAAAALGLFLKSKSIWMPFVRMMLGKFLSRVVDVKQPWWRNAILAVMVAVEKEIPDRGQGKEKLAWVLELFGHNKDVEALVEELMDSLDDALKKASNPQ